jgi:hypothetical protein
MQAQHHVQVQSARLLPLTAVLCPHKKRAVDSQAAAAAAAAAAGRNEDDGRRGACAVLHERLSINACIT